MNGKNTVSDWHFRIYYMHLYAVRYDTILYYTLLYYTILYCTILYSPLLYYTILYSTIHYYTILYYTYQKVYLRILILYSKLILILMPIPKPILILTLTLILIPILKPIYTILIYTHEALLKCLKMSQAQTEQKSPLPFWRGKPGTQGLVDWSHVTQLFSTDSSIDGLRIATWCSVTFMFFPRSNYIHSILALCIFQLCLSPGQIRSTAPVEEGDSKVTRGRSRAGKPTRFRDDTVRKSIQIGLFLKVFEMLCWIKIVWKIGCTWKWSER